MNGFVIIDKPSGLTSRDVVNIVSKKFNTKKVGHTGTLDPLATGVLVVAVNKATKLVDMVASTDKEYIAECIFGISTDTLDIEGEVLCKEDAIISEYDIINALNSFKGKYMQEVPIYSAVKVNGKKLYEYARENIEVELPKKEVTIKDIELLENNNKTFKFRAFVTKGCYIRSLIHDIGQSLGTGATMTSLIRTKQGNTSIEESCTLEEFKQGKFKLKSIEEVLDMPIIVVDSDLEFRIKNGQKLHNNWGIVDKVLFKSEDNKLLGIYEVEENHLRVWKNFY